MPRRTTPTPTPTPMPTRSLRSCTNPHQSDADWHASELRCYTARTGIGALPQERHRMMSNEPHDFGRAELLDAEAIGQPGSRRFRLFARSGRGSAVLWMEREQLEA